MRVDSLLRTAGAASAAILFLVGVAAGCGDTPSAPTVAVARPPGAAGPPAPPATVEITGHLWSYDASRRQPGTGHVSGFVFAPTWGGAMLPAPVAADGSYRARVPADSLVYLTTAGGHRPCMTAVRTAGVSEVTGIDLHVITDSTRLGSSLPPDLPQQAHRVTGMVFEPQPDGSRVPLAGVWVGLDGAMGDGLVVAGTRTDADGRYILCGVQAVAPPGTDVVLFAWLELYRPFFTGLAGTADVVIDIPLTR